MDKLKRIIDCYINTETCNLRCKYCYITQNRKFNNKLATLPDPKKVRQALSKEKMGGLCQINMCAGGETLLSDQVIELTKELLEEGHYVTLVNNNTLTRQIKKLLAFPEKLLKHLFLKCSFHYLELKRLNMLNVFVENVKMIKESPASFSIEVTPNDELIPYIDELKEFSLKHFGAYPHITVAREEISGNINHLSEHDFEEYKKIWSTFNSDLFEFKANLFYTKREEFCYAGDWALLVDIASGNLYPCNCYKRFGNVYEDKELKTMPIGNHCFLPHCFNGHFWLAFGTIPSIKTPTYASLRDRVCTDGSHWLKKEVRDFFSQKLYDNNKQYSKEEMKVKNLEQQVFQLTDNLNNKNWELGQLKQENENLKCQVCSLGQQRNMALDELSNIKSSKSYKLTAPLRKMKKVAKKILRRK